MFRNAASKKEANGPKLSLVIPDYQAKRISEPDIQLCNYFYCANTNARNFQALMHMSTKTVKLSSVTSANRGFMVSTSTYERTKGQIISGGI